MNALKLFSRNFFIKILVISFFFVITLIYLFPLVYGLVLLPLDLLVTRYAPWLEYYVNTILVKNPYMQDSITQMFPWKYFVYESFKKGVIPFWNPYQLMGMPFMAGMKPMIFYPFSLFYIFGIINAWHILLFSQIFLALIFMFYLARDFKLNIFPSILTSFTFALNALMITNLEFGSEGHVLLWFPIFFLCAKRYLDKKKGKYLFFLGISLSMSLLAGQIQYFGYGLLLLSAFILFYGHHFKTKLSVYIPLFLSVLLGIGITATQLIPSLELFGQSYRGNNTPALFLDGLSKPYHLLLLLIPDAFGNPVSRNLTPLFHGNGVYFGVIPLFFAMYAMVFLRKKTIAKFFGIAFCVSLFLAWDKIGQIFYWLKVPLFTSGSADRELSIMLFSGAILSGLGINEFVKNTSNRRNVISLFLFSFIFFVSIISGLLANKISGQTLFVTGSISYPMIVFIIFLILCIGLMLFRKRKNFVNLLFFIAIAGLTYFDFFRMGYRYLTFSNNKFLYPDTPVIKFVRDNSQKTLARNYGLVETELATPLSLYTTETYNPLYLQRTGILLSALQKQQTEKLPVNKYYLTHNDNLKHALDFLGVNYIVSAKDSNPSIEYFNSPNYENELNLVFEDEKYKVFENKTAYPRFLLYYDAQQTTSDEESLSLLSQNTIDFKKKIILEEQLPIKLNDGVGSAELISSTVNTQTFNIETDTPALFYISDTYFPGWHANVNNKETKIYRANYNFRAIIVPSGKSSVEFFYIPTGFKLGIWLTLLSFIGLIIISFFHIPSRPREVKSKSFYPNT